MNITDDEIRIAAQSWVGLTDAPNPNATSFAAGAKFVLQKLQQTQCTALCHVVNECGVGYTQVAKVFREQQAAIDYAVEMNGHAERFKLKIEYRLLEVPLA